MIRPFTQLDYPMVLDWVGKREFAFPALEFLPQIGLIVDDFCVGFLYRTDSKLCWMEWLISNPETDSGERNEAMNILINALCERAQREGYKIVFTASLNERLINRYESQRFVKTDPGMQHMLRVL